MRKVHVVTALSRMHLLEELTAHYEPMGITWHPVLFQDEDVVTFNKPWIEPFILDHTQSGFHGFIDKGYHKKNEFIRWADIEEEDYYCILDDDDMAEAGLFDHIARMDDDVVVVSMHRGYHTPADVAPARKYPATTLIASPENMRIGDVSGQQYITKGRIFRQLNFKEDFHCADGAVAVWLKERFAIRYEPELFVLFNYFEKERWTARAIAFGALVNDMARLDMCLKQSSLPGTLSVILNPESSTKGLNKLLDMFAREGSEIGVLVHQDMYFRNGWVAQAKEQIAKLPPDWIVAGIIGKDLEGNICGKFHDMRIAPVFNTLRPARVPAPGKLLRRVLHHRQPEERLPLRRGARRVRPLRHARGAAGVGAGRHALGSSTPSRSTTACVRSPGFPTRASRRVSSGCTSVFRTL